MPSEPAANQDLHVHVLNDPALEDMFKLGMDDFEQVLASADDLRGRLRVTISDLSEGAVPEALEADALIGWQFLERELIPQAKRLRWIHVIGAGVDHLEPLDWLPDRVVLTNSSGVHRERAGEYAACALLMLNSRIPQHVTSQRAHQWRPVYSDTIEGKTVTVLGVGRIGSEVARRAKQLGLTVRGVRRRPFSDEYVDVGYGVDDLDQALSGAHYLVVTVALSDATRGMIGARELELLAEDAGVVNIARAGIMDYAALVDALQRGRLRGAILDVFDPEPLPADAPYWDVENLIVTPHVSSDPVDYNRRMLEIFLDNARRLLAGERMFNVVAGA